MAQLIATRQEPCCIMCMSLKSQTDGGKSPSSPPSTLTRKRASLAIIGTNHWLNRTSWGSFQFFAQRAWNKSDSPSLGARPPLLRQPPTHFRCAVRQCTSPVQVLSQTTLADTRDTYEQQFELFRPFLAEKLYSHRPWRKTQVLAALDGIARARCAPSPPAAASKPFLYGSHLINWRTCE